MKRTLTLAQVNQIVSNDRGESSCYFSMPSFPDCVLAREVVK